MTLRSETATRQSSCAPFYLFCYLRLLYICNPTGILSSNVMFKHKKYGNIEYFNSHSISVLFFHNTNRKRQRLQHKASVAFPHSCCPEASGKIYHRPQRLHITQEMLFGACCCSSALTFFLLILHFVVIHGILLDHFVRFFLPSAQRQNGRESVCNRHQHQRSKDRSTTTV